MSSSLVQGNIFIIDSSSLFWLIKNWLTKVVFFKKNVPDKKTVHNNCWLFFLFYQVLLKTTVGDIDIELWPKEAPKAVRNFVQLSMEGYYDNTIFHRVVKDFIVQGGDPEGTGHGGESIYGYPFKVKNPSFIFVNFFFNLKFTNVIDLSHLQGLEMQDLIPHVT